MDALQPAGESSELLRSCLSDIEQVEKLLATKSSQYEMVCRKLTFLESELQRERLYNENLRGEQQRNTTYFKNIIDLEKKLCKEDAILSANLAQIQQERASFQTNKFEKVQLEKKLAFLEQEISSLRQENLQLKAQCTERDENAELKQIQCLKKKVIAANKQIGELKMVLVDREKTLDSLRLQMNTSTKMPPTADKKSANPKKRRKPEATQKESPNQKQRAPPPPRRSNQGLDLHDFNDDDDFIDSF